MKDDRRAGGGTHPATEQALQAGYVVRLAGSAPGADVDNHLLKAQESIDSATDDLASQRFIKAADSGYDAGHPAGEALMAHRGIRINKDDEALRRHGHAATAAYLAVELRHAPDVSARRPLTSPTGTTSSAASASRPPTAHGCWTRRPHARYTTHRRR